MKFIFCGLKGFKWELSASRPKSGTDEGMCSIRLSWAALKKQEDNPIFTEEDKGWKT